MIALIAAALLMSTPIHTSSGTCRLDGLASPCQMVAKVEDSGLTGIAFRLASSRIILVGQAASEDSVNLNAISINGSTPYQTYGTCTVRAPVVRCLFRATPAAANHILEFTADTI